MKSASTTNEKKAMQNVIFNCTKTALKGKTVSKTVILYPSNVHKHNKTPVN